MLVSGRLIDSDSLPRVIVQSPFIPKILASGHQFWAWYHFWHGILGPHCSLLIAIVYCIKVRFLGKPIKKNRLNDSMIYNLYRIDTQKLKVILIKTTLKNGMSLYIQSLVIYLHFATTGNQRTFPSIATTPRAAPTPVRSETEKYRRVPTVGFWYAEGLGHVDVMMDRKGWSRWSLVPPPKKTLGNRKAGKFPSTFSSVWVGAVGDILVTRRVVKMVRTCVKIIYWLNTVTFCGLYFFVFTL